MIAKNKHTRSKVYKRGSTINFYMPIALFTLKKGLIDQKTRKLSPLVNNHSNDYVCIMPPVGSEGN